MAIHPGYMGVADINGTYVRFDSANITAKQDHLIPDMVMGHWDRGAYNFGKVEISGSISGPVTENFANGGASSVWGWAYNRDSCGALSENPLTLYYFCDAGNPGYNKRTFTSMMVNGCNFSCSAGDVAQFSLDVIGAGEPVWDTGTPPLQDVTEKLVTWDNVAVSITNNGISAPADSVVSSALLSQFEFSIANNVTAIYKIGGNFYPAALVPGLRTITGSISAYDLHAFDGVAGFNTPTWNADTSRSILSFTIGGTVISFNVMFKRIEPTLSVGPIISTIGFTGVGIQPTP